LGFNEWAASPKRIMNYSIAGHKLSARKQVGNKYSKRERPIPFSISRMSARRPKVDDRVALPGGLFAGRSKVLFDVFVDLAARKLTGRFDPETPWTVRATKREVMGWSGIRSEKTIDAQIKHFVSCGVLRVHKSELGDRRGHVYEVLIKKIRPAVAQLKRNRQRQRMDPS